MDFEQIIWWAIVVVFLAMFWRLTNSVQSLVNILRKFEDLKITPQPAEPAKPVVTIHAPPPVAAPVPVPAPAPAPAEGGIPGEIVAVIAAAVDAVMSGPHRILSIAPVEATSFSAAWSTEGRRQIFHSHQVR